jgi:hypothetical protein
MWVTPNTPSLSQAVAICEFKSGATDPGPSIRIRTPLNVAPPVARTLK